MVAGDVIWSSHAQQSRGGCHERTILSPAEPEGRAHNSGESMHEISHTARHTALQRY